MNNGYVVSYYQISPPDMLDFLPSPPKVPAPLEFWPQKRFMALPLLFVILCAVGTLDIWDSLNIQGIWVSRQALSQGQWWRLLTSVFAHADLSHWGMNSIVLLLFAWMLRGYYGFLAFPILPFLTGIIANGMAIYSYEPQTRLVGASGMVFGMYGLWLIYFLKNHGEMKLSKRLARVFIFALFMLIPSKSKENVSHLAHFSGFGAGIFLGLLTMPFVHLQERNLQGLTAALRKYRKKYSYWKKKTEEIKNAQEEKDFE